MASYAFAPEIGGIETVSKLLADRWSEKGHEVVVVTEIPARHREESLSYIVVRRPSFRRLRELVEWSDVFFQNNISLRLFLPWLGSPKPFFLTHQTWIGHTRSRMHPLVLVKGLVASLATNIAISQAIAKQVCGRTTVIGNPYDEKIFAFQKDGAEVRTKDFLFVGRLVNDKGVDLFLRALGELRNEGLRFQATVAGDGPKREEAQEMVSQFGLQQQVVLCGFVRGQELASSYREHRILVVPSRWEEPFGVVALEGLASGCQLVVSSAGGLQEAAGPTCFVFPKNDWMALARILRILLAAPAPAGTLLSPHLMQHMSRTVADRYLNLFSYQTRAGSRLV